MRSYLVILVLFILNIHCNSHSPIKIQKHKKKIEFQQIASVKEMLAKKEIPILCYHQIREFKISDSKRAKDYIVPPANFRDQMKMLHDCGFVTILPDQLMDYLKFGKELPLKSIMITFDDTDEDQFTIAKPILDQYGFKAVFFIMTVSLNKKGYMNTHQVRQLAEEGHIIGSHTWDHMNVTKMNENDWLIEMDKPRFQLEEITGKKIRYFAFPFGIWNASVFEGLKKRKFDAAFQLSAKRDSNEPLFTIRRMIIPGDWSASTMWRVMENSFN